MVFLQMRNLGSQNIPHGVGNIKNFPRATRIAAALMHTGLCIFLKAADSKSFRLQAKREKEGSYRRLHLK